MNEVKTEMTLIEAGMFTLGWVVGKHGVEAPPVGPLARALKNSGADSTYLDQILTAKIVVDPPTSVSG